MSASTVSITATPNTRRRTVITTEKKSGIDIVAGDAGISLFGDDKTPGGGGSKDLSHSIRGVDVVVEKSKDVVHVKKTLPGGSTVSPRRNRKGLLKAEKPRWQTWVSVATKNLILGLIVIGLVQMISKLAAKSGNRMVSDLGVSDLEARVADVDAFLKKTVKMMQIQVEVVDRKLDSEIGDLRKELGKKIEEKGLEFGNELKKLSGKVEDLDKVLGDLRVMDLVTKDDFDRFFDEIKEAKSKESDGRGWTLDDIMAFAREVVEKEIEKHAADGLAMVDYAVGSAGGRVIRHSEPYTPGKGSSWMPRKDGVHSHAEKMVTPSFGEPGQCFPLKGSSGFVEIKLRVSIIPEAVTLEHVAKTVAYDRSSAPKDCRVTGWWEDKDKDTDVGTKAAPKMGVLTEFTYDLEKSNAQTYNVDPNFSDVVNIIRLDFTSNHGNLLHTCVYRLRVHGREPDSGSVVTM